MGKYDILIKCAQVKKLIQENKYTKALEELEGLDVSKVNSTSDLTLFAGIYEKADRFDEAKHIYYCIYKKNHSKRALYNLILMVVRLGDLKEAHDLYMEYESAAGINLDTYILRYQLAKAEGVSRQKLIALLEDLKQEEFTEEWGYQLAKLYELEGDRKKCIEVCDDIALWFGTGSIVNKARQLRDEVVEPDWQSPKDDTIPEPMKPDLEEEIPLSYETPLTTIYKEEEVVIEETPIKKEEQVDNKQELESVPEPKVESVPRIEKEPEDTPVEEVTEEREENIFISENDIYYFTLRDTIAQVHTNTRGVVHFAIAGGEERISLAIAKKLIKELNNIGYFSANSIAKVKAEKLNGVTLEERMNKLVGGCMLILNAPMMTEETAGQVEQAMEKYKNDIVFVLTGDYDELDCWFASHRSLDNQICYKVRL